MMPSWNQCLQAIVLLAIAGFGVVVLSGFWHILALLCITSAILWLWRGRSSSRRW